MNKFILCLLISLCCTFVQAQEDTANQEDEVVNISGTSIIGNKELPKSLFIVPWKNAEVGDNTTLSDTLGDTETVVDRQVFLREIQYYEFLQDIND